MKMVKIEDIANIVSKGTTPTSIDLSFAGSGIPFLKGENVLGTSVNLKKTNTFIDEATHSKLSRSELICGDVLITIAGTIGRVAYIAEESKKANCNQAVAFVRMHLKRIDPAWLCLLLQSPSYQYQFAKFVTGGAIPNISLNQINSIKIPDISIVEQRQIAAQLKTQLAKVEQARKAAEMQLQEIKTLFNRILENQIFKALKNGKEKVILGDVVEITAKLVNPELPEFCNLPHVSAKNIEGLTGRLLNIRSAKEDGMTSSKYLFEDDDILYSKLRPYLRKIAQPDFSGLCSADMYPLKCDPKRIDRGFLKILLTSSFFTDYAKEKSARSRMPKLNREQLFKWEFILPSLNQQIECQNLINSASELATEASKAAKSILYELNLLPQKILAQAFEI